MMTVGQNEYSYLCDIFTGYLEEVYYLSKDGERKAVKPGTGLEKFKSSKFVLGLAEIPEESQTVECLEHFIGQPDMEPGLMNEYEEWPLIDELVNPVKFDSSSEGKLFFGLNNIQL